MPEQLLNWLPLIVAFVTLIGGAIVYNIQKAVDRRNLIHEERRGLYAESIVVFQKFRHDAFVDSISNDNKYEQLKAFKTMLTRLAVSAPDAVVVAARDLDGVLMDAWTAYFNLKSEEGQGREPPDNGISDSIERLVLAMREDTFEETKIKSISLDVSAFGFSIGLSR